MSDPVPAADDIAAGRTGLGIELGSTRIKAVLIGTTGETAFQVLASGAYEWENQFVDRRWTYALEDVWTGVQACFATLAAEVVDRYGVPLTSVGSLGVSAMMHGYLAFDGDDQLLVPFRTWRNTNTGPAVERLSAAFGVNIPHRWSIAHLYQAILDGEQHLDSLASITTLAGYVHRQLTGEHVLGVGDASGMFPIAAGGDAYEPGLIAIFEELAERSGANLRLGELLPAIRRAGEPAGTLSTEGARLLDPSGRLDPGAPMCAPEGDAGTGMVATNSVALRTGNVSAGTSIFAMVVLEQPLASVHHELDLVTTPAGDPVAMVHCNNGASEINSWAALFGEFAAALGTPTDPGRVFEALFRAALNAEPDAGGVLAYNYLSGEPITGLEEGRPLLLRAPASTFSLANFARAHLFGALATLALGMDVLRAEGVRLDRMFAHGGLFKTAGVAQRFLAAAIDTPVSVGDIAAEGGAWGIAVLAAYRVDDSGLSLGEFLDQRVFGTAELITCEPDPDDVQGFSTYVERFRAGLPIERLASELG